MKTRLFTALIALILMLSLAACGQPVSQNSAPVMGTFGEKDLVFVYNGTEYPLLSDVAPLLEALGSDYTMDGSPSCVYSQYGDDKTFAYKDIEMQTNPTKEGKDIFYEIDIAGGDYATNKGIKIGSTLEEVKAAYGAGGFEKDGLYMYNMSGDADDIKSPSLGFQIEEGAVSWISYYSPTNLT
jgi:hypothetical protein